MASTMLPLVSIRVPAYNHENYIEACLDSVLAEEYPNKELVIINDGSTDRTELIIKAWLEKHKNSIPVLFRSRGNLGLTATLNELIGLCRGEFLVSLASDDALISGGIRARVDYLEKHTNKEAVIGDCNVIDENGSIQYDSALTGLYSANLQNYQTDNGLKYEVIWNWSIPGPSLMVRRSLYSRIGLYNPDMSVEDWDLYLRMVSEDLLGFVPACVASYRIHAKNVSRKLNEEHVRRGLIHSAIRNLRRFRGAYRRLLLRKLAVYVYQTMVGRFRSLMRPDGHE